jgi:chitodextrinase
MSINNTPAVKLMMKKALILLIIVGSFEQYIWGQGQSKNVLFIGNSYSEYVPWLVENIASSMGDNLNYGSSIITVGGYSLYLHSSQPSTLSLIRQGGWDLVVLQDHSRYPSEPINFVEEYVYPYAQYLDEQINMYNPGAETMFYMTWGRRDGDADRCPVNPPVCTYIGMDDLTRERYMYMAEVNHAVISPVSAVWRYIRQNHPSIELYQSDGSHPSDAGFYAAACCFYTAIFRRDPRLITYNYNLSSDNADKIKNAAKLVVFDNLLTWHIGEYDQDTQAPTVPSGLSASNITPASFTLSWNASTDNIGVTGYDVYRNGTLVNTVTTTSVNITGLAASTTYSMTVRAKDAAGNISDPSTALNVTTSVPPDTQPPTIPTGLTANNITQTSFTLTWLASTDNVAVTGYDVYRNGNFLSTVAATSSNITGLTAGTTYSMTVRAKDAAGNISDPSIALNVTTTSAPDTQAPVFRLDCLQVIFLQQVSH